MYTSISRQSPLIPEAATRNGQQPPGIDTASTRRVLTTNFHHDLAQAKAGQAGPVKGGPRDRPASRLFRTLQCYFCPTGRGQARPGQTRPGQARATLGGSNLDAICHTWATLGSNLDAISHTSVQNRHCLSRTGQPGSPNTTCFPGFPHLD